MKSALLALKIAVSVLLLALVVSFVDVNALRPHLMRADPFWLSLSLVALVCQFVLSMFRWHDVCAVFGLDVSYGEVLSLGLVGQMFNQVLPTNFGGDGVRVLAMSRRGWGWTVAARTVLVDRAVGLLFIVGVATLSLLVALCTGRPPIPRAGFVLTATMAVLVTIILLIAFAAPVAERLQQRYSIVRPVAWGLNGLQAVFASRRWTPPILTKAMLVHLLLVQSFCFLAAALGIAMSRDMYLLVTLILLASAFPLSFAGWGVREGAAVTVLSLIGVSPTDAILVSVLHGVGQIVIGLFGVPLIPFWLLGRRTP